MERSDAVAALPELLPFVAGERYLEADAESLAVEDPTTGEPLAHFPAAGEQAVDDAVAAAQAAMDGAWGGTSTRDRGHLLRRLALLITDEAEHFAALETLDVGKPLREARGIDVAQAVEAFQYFAGLADKVEGRLIPLRDRRLEASVHREPLGVVAAIIPWNFPLLMAAWKLAPALAAGCSVVLKVSELTPLSASLLADLILEAGFPSGSVNILCGRGEVAGRALVDHPGVDKVSFTGSTAVGKEIMQRGAATLKRISLELGGKSANLVFGDVPDLDRTAAQVAQAAFYNAGECCTAGSRVLVERSIFDDFVSRLVDRAKRIKLGDPFSERRGMGPLISRAHLERVHRFVAEARDAPCIVGGEPVQIDGFPKGHWYPPTILKPGDPQSDVVQDEIFGPVLCVLPFDDEEEATALANGTPFGLAAGVWTGNSSRARRIAGRLRAGSVWINTYNRFDAAVPFGGVKGSGFGRENGREALDLYSEAKAVWTEFSAEPRP